MVAIDILSDERCELGEGPFYCQRRDTLFWFDIIGNKRHAFNFSSGTKAVVMMPEMASAMAVIDEDRDLILTESGLWSIDIKTGAFSPIASIEADNEITRSNDARVHPSGAFWISTMGKSAEKEAGAIYHFHGGTLTMLFSDLTIPNAICFSPDGEIGYFTDTITAKLMAVAVDAATGLPVGEPKALIDHTGKDGGLDGAIVDADGNIWIALWGASRLNCYASDGKLKSSYDLPVTQPTCPVFVGGGKIAVTSAWQGMSDKQKSTDAKAGNTLVVDIAAKPKYEPPVQI